VNLWKKDQVCPVTWKGEKKNKAAWHLAAQKKSMVVLGKEGGLPCKSSLYPLLEKVLAEKGEKRGKKGEGKCGRKGGN